MSMENRVNVVKRLAEHMGVAEKEAQRWVKGLSECVVDGVMSGDRMYIKGLVQFVLVDVPARTGRNPKTGEVLEIAACQKVKAKALVKCDE